MTEPSTGGMPTPWRSPWPFAPLDPFRSGLSLTARLQLGRYSTSVGTYVQPDGRVDYAASAGTFLYLGEFGVQPQRIGGVAALPGMSSVDGWRMRPGRRWKARR